MMLATMTNFGSDHRWLDRCTLHSPCGFFLSKETAQKDWRPVARSQDRLGPLTRSLRPDRVGGDLWRGSTPGGNFALATSLSGVLITRQRQGRDFFGPSPAGSTLREPPKG